jgi:cyclohexanone monooxygenase
MTKTDKPPDHVVDALIVGAGFTGIYALIKLRSLGFSVRMVDAAEDVGGTWYWNRYPGCRCDAESIEYSYSFSEEVQQEWTWSEKYATQPEILRYLKYVANRFDVYSHSDFRTIVKSLTYNEQKKRWLAVTGHSVIDAQYCVMATGCLSVPILPTLPALEDFRGNVYHTGNWPHETVDFTNQNVAVIGTGSSGIQAIPSIARQAATTTVFQRTAAYSIPARNRPLSLEEVATAKADYPQLRHLARNSSFGISWAARESNHQSALEIPDEARLAEYERRWQHGGSAFLIAYSDLLLNAQANKTAADFVRSKIRELVRDPEVAQKLMPPHDLPIGCKRICVDTDYFATFNEPNVALVDLRQTPIERITANGIQTTDQHRAFDSIVFATGFDAITGALLRIDIRGKQGLRLKDKWRDGPGAYLGLSVAGFPNMFLMTGPGSPSVFGNVVMTSEQHVEWVAGFMVYARKQDVREIEAEPDAEQEWVQHVGDIAAHTLLGNSCNSWYVGANVPGKPRVFMVYAGGLNTYASRCNAIEASGYTGFACRKSDYTERGGVLD